MAGHGSNEFGRVLHLCVQAFREEQVVLLHCYSGKHRSGAFCSLLAAFMDQNFIEGGMQTHFDQRPLNEKDQGKVSGICQRLGLQEFLSALVREKFCEHELGTMRAVKPQAKSRPGKPLPQGWRPGSGLRTNAPSLTSSGSGVPAGLRLPKQHRWIGPSEIYPQDSQLPRRPKPSGAPSGRSESESTEPPRVLHLRSAPGQGTGDHRTGSGVPGSGVAGSGVPEDAHGEEEEPLRRHASRTVPATLRPRKVTTPPRKPLALLTPRASGVRSGVPELSLIHI